MSKRARSSKTVRCAVSTSSATFCRSIRRYNKRIGHQTAEPIASRADCLTKRNRIDSGIARRVRRNEGVRRTGSAIKTRPRLLNNSTFRLYKAAPILNFLEPVSRASVIPFRQPKTRSKCGKQAIGGNALNRYSVSIQPAEYGRKLVRVVDRETGAVVELKYGSTVSSEWIRTMAPFIAQEAIGGKHKAKSKKERKKRNENDVHTA